MRLATMVAMAALVAAPRAEAQKKGCEPVSADISAFAMRQVFAKCELDKEAKAPRPPRTNPNEMYVGEMSTPCVRATIEFVVDSNGAPLVPTARIVKTNDTSYAQFVIRGLSSLKFTPARKDDKTVAQLVS